MADAEALDPAAEAARRYQPAFDSFLADAPFGTTAFVQSAFVAGAQWALAAARDGDEVTVADLRARQRQLREERAQMRSDGRI